MLPFASLLLVLTSGVEVAPAPRLTPAPVVVQTPAPAQPPAASQPPEPRQGKKGFGQKKGPVATSSAPGEALPGGLIKFRPLGPAVTSGRIVGFAVNPKDRAHYFVAVASGGVWKTTNAGTTWAPVFDSEGSFSIGCVVMDPKNPEVIWVGTGENNSQRSVGYGDGVYKSTDGGRSWTNLGLKASEHIGDILIDPTNSDVVYVAAQGPLWSPGGDRGLFKTIDGGKTWVKALDIDEHTGINDVVMPNPATPDVLVASSYQRRRHVWTIINGGPGSAIHRSTDGGKTWKKATGIPGGDLGRIGLASAPSGPNTVYATIEANAGQGGVFRSTDGGATWEKRNSYDTQAQYYSHPVVDPVNKDRVYLMNVFIQVSDDGGANFRGLGDRDKHVDNHEIWIDPKDPKYYLVGCDGGIYESFDRANTWNFKSNLPVTQFYAIGVDQNPASGPFYHVYGGTQDNFTLGGPVRTRSINGITNADWYVVQGGDGFHCKVDPTDPNVVYGESQYGGLCRYDRKTGTRLNIQPIAKPGQGALRWNWDSPLIVSPHNPKRIYFAANYLFRSDDRGDSWKAISPDLSRQLDRDALPVMGKVWGPDAIFKHQSTSFYGNIVSLAESYKTEGLLYVGTDDGLIQIADDGGPGWRRVDKFPGVPDRTYVSKLVTSQHDATTVYAAFDNHKNGDFKPYLLKSTDGGRTWASIASDLPERGTVYAIAEDHVDANLLFVGTEFGLYYTTDGGKAWIRMKGGLPTSQVKDLVIQKHNNDLIVGTFGRGFYVFDDYSALRSYKPSILNKPAHIFAPETAVQYAQSSQLGGGGKSFQGSSFYTADNPAFGATFQIYVKEVPKTLKQKRLDAEKVAAEANKPKTYPSREEERAELEEEAPSLTLAIVTADGFPVSTLGVPVTTGLHRVNWSLRDGTTGGPVIPGKYTATLGLRAGGKYTQLADPVTVTVAADSLSALTPAQYAEIAEFDKKLRALRRAMAAASGTAADLASKLETVKAAVDQLPPAEEPAKLLVRKMIAEVKLMQRTFNGDSFLASKGDNVSESLSDRVNFAASANRGAISPPMGSQKEAYAVASKQLAAEIAKLRTMLDVDLPSLEKKIEAAGGPWIPGKLPVWDGK